jgi:hypothetical protein
MTARRVACIAAGLLVVGGAGQAQTLRTVASSRQLQNEEALAVHVRFGVGQFRLDREHGSALYRASLVFDEEAFEPIFEYDPSARTLEVGVDALGEHLEFRDMDEPRQRLDLALSPLVATSIDLEFGAGRADIDLGGLSIERATIRTGASESVVQFSRPTVAPCELLEINVGAAEFRADRLGNSNCEHIDVDAAAGGITLDFTGEWQHTGVTTAEVTIGLGNLNLRFPSHLGVAIELERFLASFDRAGFVKRGDRYVSEGYDQAESRLDLRLKAVFGDVNVVWVPQ